MVFQKGVSPNPGGKPSTFRAEFQKLAKEKNCLELAMNVLLEAMKGKDKVEAAEYLIDQIIGKASQNVDLGNSDTSFKVTIGNSN